MSFSWKEANETYRNDYGHFKHSVREDLKVVVAVLVLAIAVRDFCFI